MGDAKNAIHWWETERVAPGAALEGEVRCDICIVGAGYTGMWAAYFLKQAEPTLDVRIVEAEWAGAGASGHNDGYAMTTLDQSLHHLVAHHGVEPARRAHDAVARSVVEIGEFCERHGVDAEYELNGFLALATNPGQLRRLERDHEAAQAIGATADFELLDAEGARSRIGSPIVSGGLRERQGAILNPLKLARGICRVLREEGVTIYERTPATEVSTRDGRAVVTTSRGRVEADQAIVATNAYQHSFSEFRNKLLPLWSYAMASEPLTDEQLARAAWPGREGFEDKRTYIAGGRLTAENRLLFWGRYAPYFYGNDMKPRHIWNERAGRELSEAFERFFPMWREIRFTHAYGGCIALTADFLPHFGRLSDAVAYGYGYCGHGVAPSHTGGKVLRDLVLGGRGEYTDLLFVNGKEPSFPPEPLKFLGLRLTEWLLYRQDRRLDRGKGRGDKEPFLVRLLSGR